MVVRIQVIKVYSLDVPDEVLDGVAPDEREYAATTWAYDQQTTWIQKHGILEDASTDFAEVYSDDDEE